MSYKIKSIVSSYNSSKMLILSCQKSDFDFQMNIKTKDIKKSSSHYQNFREASKTSSKKPK